MGFTTLVYGDTDRATVLLDESLALFREVEDTMDVATCLVNLGLAVLVNGEHKRAVGLLQESLALTPRGLGDRLGIAECFEAMAGVSGAQGKSKRAVWLWGAAQALREDLKTPLPDDERMILEPYLDAARSQLGEAAWEKAFAEGRATEPENVVGFALSEKEAADSTSPTAKRRSKTGERQAALTRREEEIATLLGQGLTNRQIASDLSISEHTAATHVRRILKKLGLTSRSQIGSWLTQQQP